MVELIKPKKRGQYQLHTPLSKLSAGTLFRERKVAFWASKTKLNGLNDVSSPFTLSGSDIFTGTLEDGSAFVFSNQASDSLNGVNLIETSTPTIDTTPQTIDTASTLRNLRAGQTLTVQTGGELGDNFTAVDATLNVLDGSVGDLAEVARTQRCGRLRGYSAVYPVVYR